MCHLRINLIWPIYLFVMLMQAAAFAHSLFCTCYKFNMQVKNATVLLLLAEIHKVLRIRRYWSPYQLSCRNNGTKLWFHLLVEHDFCSLWFSPWTLLSTSIKTIKFLYGIHPNWISYIHQAFYCWNIIWLFDHFTLFYFAEFLPLLFFFFVHQRSGNTVLGIPYALASLSFCQSFNLDLLKASATLMLAELWLSLGSNHAKKALALLHSSFPMLLGHGGLELRSRAFITEAKCYLADPSFSGIYISLHLAFENQDYIWFPRTAGYLFVPRMGVELLYSIS